MSLTDEQKAEIAVNRANYEKLKTAGQGVSPRALPALTPRDGAALSPSDVLARETIPGGWYWYGKVLRGETLRLLNADGRSSASVIAWNAQDVSERINHADTVKVQWSAALRAGRVILSDMGKVIFSITQDTSGAHDALVGGSNAASNARKYGGDFRNTRDNFILAATKLGLTRADIPLPVTFFAPVETDADGKFVWNEAKRAKNDFVDLRAEQDVLVAISNCPHPFDPAPDYAPGPLDLIRYRLPVAADDFCRSGSAESVRAFENTFA
ncbi:urea carboxylase-associated protein 2 [Rhodoblastus acidophilus]|uniref:urea amidolyase associated protein UAAP1 n=1 Tax=Rhodoblastus acidophilus TaxID=1074 RepID=UPI0022244395|nr:urea amidolyase associated protein UAAP1 [Rhodoblastus acidophilus]MCW2286851.1 urea carboxylase-associated protein 2 [Rhodoblastus acidophilus]MCW2335717.1 urea carboxylase-associated protein 2 [Rhodoblastus acidophilus]